MLVIEIINEIASGHKFVSHIKIGYETNCLVLIGETNCLFLLVMICANVGVCE